MEDEKLNKYLLNIQKIISSGGPKYISYISKEYMKYRTINPIISDKIHSIIFKEVSKNNSSPYAIFLDEDGTINLESMSDISKIDNISQFIRQIEALSKVGIDFRKISAEDLIIEGSEIAEKLAQDLENENISEKEASDLSKNADDTIEKVGALAVIGGTIGAMASRIFARIKAGMQKLGNRKPQAKLEKPQEKSEPIEYTTRESTLICPKVEVNEAEAIAKMNEKSEETEKAQNTDTYGDGDPDGDDLNL